MALVFPLPPVEGNCTRGCNAPGEVPWGTERLCWDCMDPELDRLAIAASLGEPVTVCRSTGSGDYPAERRGHEAAIRS